MVLSGDKRDRNTLKDLRVIPFEKYPGALNMALDLYFATNVSETKIPVLRFYGWTPQCISIGFHQNYDMVAQDKIDNVDIQCVRRPTGGSAILHYSELTYSFMIPRELMGHLEMYQIFHEILASSLNQLGYEVELHRQTNDENYLKMGAKSFACFNRPAFSEIKFAGKKVVGSAQKIYEKSILQHGSILIGREQDGIIDYLNVKEKEKKNFRKELVTKSVSLNEINSNGITEIELSEQLIDGFCRRVAKNVFYHFPDAREIDNARNFENKFQLKTNN